MQHIPQINISEASVELGTKPPSNRRAYFVGSGIASLAGAAFLIRDGLIPGEAIQIFEELQEQWR